VAAEGQRRDALRPVTALAAGTVLLLAVVVLGVTARGGSYTGSADGATFRGPVRAATTTIPRPPEPTIPPLPDPTPRGSLPFDEILLALLLLGVVVLVVLAVRLLLRHLTRGLPSRATGAVAAEPSPAEAREELTDAVERALVAVEQPAARDAVVQAWLLLGAAAAAAGTPAMPAETAAEYAERLTATHRLPAAALHHLAELYRVARFSEHPVGEAERSDARRVLTELRTGLAVG
jgi:hypothetical protein